MRALLYGLTNLIGLFVCLFVFRDPENSLLQNLKDVLEIDFPARTILEESVSLIIASIVYIMLIIKFQWFSQENKAEKEKKLEVCCNTEFLVKVTLASMDLLTVC